MEQIKIKIARGNYIHFKYLVRDGTPFIEMKDRNKKFWYYKFENGEFKIISVTSKSIFEDLPENLEKD